jgi:outer membrane lipoprotein SlyB
MRNALKFGAIVIVLFTIPVAAEAGKTEGVAVGAGAGALVAGPVGAVVGGVVGYKVGGPNIVTKPYRRCWRDDWGYRHCVWR